MKQKQNKLEIKKNFFNNFKFISKFKLNKMDSLIKAFTILSLVLFFLALNTNAKEMKKMPQIGTIENKKMMQTILNDDQNQKSKLETEVKTEQENKNRQLKTGNLKHLFPIFPLFDSESNSIEIKKELSSEK